MSKVYCKNCRYGNKGWDFCQYNPKYQYEEIGSEFCGSFKKKIKDKNTQLFPAYKFELNKTGECFYYQPQWWWKLLRLTQ